MYKFHSDFILVPTHKTLGLGFNREKLRLSDTDRPYVHGSWLLIWRQFLGCFSNANSTSILCLFDLENIFFQWNMMFNVRKLMFSWKDLLAEVEPSVKKVNMSLVMTKLGSWTLNVCFDFSYMIKLSKVEIKKRFSGQRVFMDQ